MMDSLAYQQYLVEKEIAHKLSGSTLAERKIAYKYLYGEFFNKFPLVGNGLRKDSTHKLEWQMRLLKPFLNKTQCFLEVGAGNCLLSSEISKYVDHVIAYEVADLTSTKSDLPSNLKIQVYNGIDFYEKNNTIDVIYSNDVFEHLHIEDSPFHVAQYYNILKHKGKLIIITPHSYTGPHDISRYYSKRPEGLHMKEYTYSELFEMLKFNGFQNIRAFLGSKKIGYIPLPIQIFICLEFLYSLFPQILRYRLKNYKVIQKLLSIKVISIRK